MSKNNHGNKFMTVFLCALMLTGILALLSNFQLPIANAQTGATLHGGGCSTTVDFPDSSLTHLGGETTFYEFRPKDWAWAVDMLEKGGFQQELEDFVQCVRTRETPRAPAEDAVESHRMVDTIYRMCCLATLA